LAVLLLALLAGLLGVASWQGTRAAGGSPVSGVARLAVRLLLVGVSLGAWFLTQSLIGGRKDSEGKIGDLLHDLTGPWNTWLRDHPRPTNVILIVSSAFIDLFAVFLIGAGIFGSTLRPFLALLILFTFRQVCQALCALPVPPGMIWRHPGVPSLLVTYGVSNDFFISGHTAIAVLGAIEVCHLLPPWCGMAAGLVALLEGGVVIVLRAHYTMDVLGAVVAAFCAAGLAGYICQVFGV
jgi:membrane-associated phospholipid phosphatase